VRAPRCAVCDADGRFAVGLPFRVVEFADFTPRVDENEGGPWPGADWFCPAHAERAAELSQQRMTIEQAVQQLRCDESIRTHPSAV